MLFGPHEQYISLLDKAFPETRINSRGHRIKLLGPSEQVTSITSVIDGMIEIIHRSKEITKNDVTTLLNMYESERKATEAFYGPSDNVILFTNTGERVLAKTPGQKDIVNSVQKNDIVFAIGPAGTGKTYTSVALAVRALKERKVKKIILARPAVEAGENLGFLPGDLKEKIDPYLRPLYDALEEMIDHDKLDSHLSKNTIEIAPLAYMRGRTLNNAFVILDEAQNATNTQMKMFLTRIGFNSQAIITGDVTQTDLPKKQESGLISIQSILKDIEGIDFVYLDQKDVVRHKLVRDIIEAYEKADEDRSK